MAGRGAGLLGLAAQLLIHAQALGQKDAPFVSLIFDQFDFKTSAAQQFGVLGDADERRRCHPVPQKLFVRA